MRLVVRLLSAVAVVLLAVGLGWAYVDRDADSATGPLVVLALGVVAGVAATAVWVLVERRPGRLVVPAEFAEQTKGGTRLPMPAWWAPIGAIGAVAVAGGALVSLPVLLVGATLLAAAIVGAVNWVPTRQAVLDRRAVRAARALRSFADAHAVDGDATAEGVVAYVGRGATKISVIAADGQYGEQVVAGYERARLAAAMAGMTVHDEWPRELISRVRTGPYEWSRMAGIQVGGRRNR